MEDTDSLHVQSVGKNMNYEKYIQEIISNKKSLLVVIAIIGVLLILIEAALRPKQNIIPLASVDSITKQVDMSKTNPLIDQVKSSKILAKDSINLSKIPNTVDSYTYMPPSFSESEAYQYFDRLNLKLYREVEDPLLGKVLYARNGNQKMVAYLGRKKINFNDSTEFKKGLTRENDYYKKRAEDYLKSIGLNLINYEFVSSSFIGGNATERTIVENKLDAVSVELLYKFAINGIPVAYNDKTISGNFISIWVTDNGQIQKFSYEYGGSVGEKIGQYKLLAKDDILKNINGGNAKLTSGFISDQQSIQSVEVKDVKVAYYAKDDKLLPIFYMTGLIKTDKKDTLGYLVMDAIENEQKK